MPDRGLQRFSQAVHPERAIDLLVSEVPEVNRQACGRRVEDAAQRSRAAPRPDTRRFASGEAPQLQVTVAAASAGVDMNIAPRTSGDSGRLLTIGNASECAIGLSLASTHCQRPRISSADLPAGAYSTTAS